MMGGKAACEGYSKAAKLLLDICSVEAFVVGGQSKNADGEYEGHMWDVVKIDGSYYNLDLTWDDPISQEKNDEPRYTYFNLTDEDISKTHSDFEKIYPCTATSKNYYNYNGLYFSKYNEGFRTKLAEIIADAVNDGSRGIEIRFANKGAYDSALDGLFADEQIYRVLTVANLSADKKISATQVSYIQNDDYHVIEIIFVFK